MRFSADGAANEIEFGLLCRRAETWDLIVGAQPADDATRLLLRALLVERDEAGEDVVVGEIGRPAIGLGHGGIEFVVQFLQDQHEAIVEGVPVLTGQCGGIGARAELFQNVVDAGEGKMRMLGQ